jgi:hypothetical protein
MTNSNNWWFPLFYRVGLCFKIPRKFGLKYCLILASTTDLMSRPLAPKLKIILHFTKTAY